MKISTIDISKIVIPIIYIIIGIVVYKIVKTFINKSLEVSVIGKRKKLKRRETIGNLLINIIKYIIVLIVFIAILDSIGINVKSILAGLGITAAIIGLAFQDIAKDFLSGISIILEDQYEIGDMVEIDGFLGEVTYLGLKTTRIKNYKGEVLIISNHTINKIINYSINNNLAVVDVSISYEENLDKVEKVLEDLSKKLNNKIKNTVGELKVLGITNLDESAVIYRLAIESKPAEYIAVERALRKEIKKYLDENNIKIPYKQIEVHNAGKKL